MVETFSRIDILVNNAAVDPTEDFLTVSELFWETGFSYQSVIMQSPFMRPWRNSVFIPSNNGSLITLIAEKWQAFGWNVYEINGNESWELTKPWARLFCPMEDPQSLSRIRLWGMGSLCCMGNQMCIMCVGHQNNLSYFLIKGNPK